MKKIDTYKWQTFLFRIHTHTPLLRRNPEGRKQIWKRKCFSYYIHIRLKLLSHPQSKDDECVFNLNFVHFPCKGCDFGDNVYLCNRTMTLELQVSYILNLCPYNISYQNQLINTTYL